MREDIQGYNVNSTDLECKRQYKVCRAEIVMMEFTDKYVFLIRGFIVMVVYFLLNQYKYHLENGCFKRSMLQIICKSGYKNEIYNCLMALCEVDIMPSIKILELVFQ